MVNQGLMTVPLQKIADIINRLQETSFSRDRAPPPAEDCRSFQTASPAALEALLVAFTPGWSLGAAKSVRAPGPRQALLARCFQNGTWHPEYMDFTIAPALTN
jgi:hypothetical protein